MKRTVEQKAADAALDVAIEAAMLAYGLLSPEEMTQEYVLLVATQKWDPEEERASNGYTMLMRDGAVASTRILGLLEMASHDVKTGSPDD